ncbi:hypothetical protein ASPVEDRAFT_35964, partial [Aspergillus versicolor CBS 583.65]
MTVNPFKESNSNLRRIYFTLYDEANLLFSSITGCWASAGPKEGCVALEQQLRECMDSHVRIIHLPTPEFWHIPDLYVLHYHGPPWFCSDLSNAES